MFTSQKKANMFCVWKQKLQKQEWRKGRKRSRGKGEEEQEQEEKEEEEEQEEDKPKSKEKFVLLPSECFFPPVQTFLTGASSSKYQQFQIQMGSGDDIAKSQPLVFGFTWVFFGPKFIHYCLFKIFILLQISLHHVILPWKEIS